MMASRLITAAAERSAAELQPFCSAHRAAGCSRQAFDLLLDFLEAFAHRFVQIVRAATCRARKDMWQEFVSNVLYCFLAAVAICDEAPNNLFTAEHARLHAMPVLIFRHVPAAGAQNNGSGRHE